MPSPSRVHCIRVAVAVVCAFAAPLAGCDHTLSEPVAAEHAGPSFGAGVHSTAWMVGDVFAPIGNGAIRVFDNAGGFKEEFNQGQLGLLLGCGFNPALDRLYAANSPLAVVQVFDDAPPHPVLQTISSGGGNTSPESIAFDAAGNFFVGHTGGAQQIEKRDAAGALLASFTPAPRTRRIELAADQRTIFYTTEGAGIYRFDTETTSQLPPFSTTGESMYGLRLLPPFDGSGGLLVANTRDVLRLDGSGNVAQTYTVEGEGHWFAVNLDPNGTSFWAGNFVTSNFYRFHIATGAVEVGPISAAAAPFRLLGLCLKGEITAGTHPVVVALHDVYSGLPRQAPGVIRLQDEWVYAEILDIERYLPRSATPNQVRFGSDYATGAPAESVTVLDLDGDGRRDVSVRWSRAALVTGGQLGCDTRRVSIVGRDEAGRVYRGDHEVEVVGCPSKTDGMRPGGAWPARRDRAGTVAPRARGDS